MLIITLVISLCLNVYFYFLLQNSVGQNLKGSVYAASSFTADLGRATFFLNVQKPEDVDNNIQAYVYCALSALENLWTLRELNPQYLNYFEPIEDVVRFLSISIPTPPTIPQVLAIVSCNASLAMKAMNELNQTASQKIFEMSHEVLEAFTSHGVNASRLQNAVNFVSELQTILDQWVAKYSQT